MSAISFKLEAFEGPLDLLLTLIRKNKIDIYDIPIATVLDQYMSTIEDMKKLNLEVSSEFLVIAATLLHIKSKMLLPKYDEDDESDIDPREMLVKRLIEYQKYKEATHFLISHQNLGNLSFFKAPDFIEPRESDFNFKKLTCENLLKAYNNTCFKLERRTPPPKTSFSGIVGYEKVSIKEKAFRIWEKLKTLKSLPFLSLFKKTQNRAATVASFLAVLELIKQSKIRVEYNDDNVCTVFKTSDDTTLYFENE